jgi:diguanylate cyclase (GGDEF)-like protein
MQIRDRYGKIDKVAVAEYSEVMEKSLDSIINSPSFSDFLFNNLDVAIFLVDRDFNVTMVNNPFTTMFSVKESTACSRLCGNVLGCEYAVIQNKPCGQTTECGRCKLRESLLRGFVGPEEVSTTFVSRSFYINDVPVKKHFKITSRKAVFGQKPMVVVAMHDITDVEEQKQKIQELSNHDFLTGLANRRYFFEACEPLFQNAKRGSINISIAMFDIDSFKRINDSHGHACGDSILREVSIILADNLRKADIVARFGGEEFCLLLHCADASDAYSVVDKLRLLVETHAFAYEGKSIPVTISAGLTSKLEESLDEMIKKADEMLLKAKEGGRNRTEECS